MWLAANPDDHHLRGLLSTQFLRLGLATPAREHASRLPASGGAALLHAAKRLAHDQLSLPLRIDTLTGNLAAAQGGALNPLTTDTLEQAHAALAGTEPEQWLRCADGTIVSRAASGPDERPFTDFEDGAGWARSLPLASGQAVVYIDGLSHPAVLRRVAAALPAGGDGFWPRIVVIELRIERLARALASHDLRDMLSQPRFEWHVGPSAMDTFGASLVQRAALVINGPVVPGSPPTPGTPMVRSVVAALVARAVHTQEGEVPRLALHLRSPACERGAGWWAARYAGALSGTGEPLRVLVSTTRYSTYVQHASRDIAAAFEAVGCRTRLLLEPDHASRLTNVASGHTFETFKPDLVLVLNYTRRHLGPMAPRDVPYVCWVQDAMPHLFERSQGEGQGPMDFLVGHLHGEFFSRFAYPPQRALAIPVLASAAKFHAGPVPADLAARFSCEVGAATNQSETPEQLRDRALAANAARPQVSAIIRALYPAIERAVRASDAALCMDALRGAAEEHLRAATGTAEPTTLAMLINQVALPLADRMLRHRVLAWTGAICERRGWRFHLYGEGWESHPTLGRFAKGPVAHGEHLRAAYQCARVSLHASINWNLHQRILECALAGGLPLALRKRDDLVLLEWCAARSISLDTPAPAHGGTASAADHHHAMMLVAQCQRLGLPHDGRITHDRAHWLAHGRHGWGGALAPEVVWLMGDMAETTFANAAELEGVLDRVIASPALRTNLADGIRRRVAAHLTYERAAPAILELIRSSLAEQAPA